MSVAKDILFEGLTDPLERSAAIGIIQDIVNGAESAEHIGKSLTGSFLSEELILKSLYHLIKFGFIQINNSQITLRDKGHELSAQTDFKALSFNAFVKIRSLYSEYCAKERLEWLEQTTQMLECGKSFINKY